MPEKDSFEKIDKLESIIDSKLKNSSSNKDLEELERKISSFKPKINGSNISTNNNNVVEFMSKLFFDKNNLSNRITEVTDKNKAVQDMLNKEQWNKLYGIEKERINRYSEYEIIYSYIPELASCIDSFRDSIIAPDSLTNISVPIKLPDNVVSEEAKNLFENNKNVLEKKYKLKELQKQIIGDTLKLGDQFVAVLGYENEFQKLLFNENQKVMLPPEFLDPSLKKEENILNESFYQEPIFADLKKVLNEEFENGKNKDASDNYDKVVSNIKNILQNIKVKDSKDFKEANDVGLNSRKIDLSKLNIKGCMVKKLDPSYTVKLEVDGINLGYLYAQKQKDYNVKSADENLVQDFFASKTNTIKDVQGKSKEEIIFNILGRGIAKKIDLDFIEENKEFKDLLYLLLKNEDLLKGNVEFIYFSPEEVTHFFVDKDGVYGTSRLAKSLFFAKLYIPSILNEFMQKLTRGRDKRVIYVDVGIDEASEESIQEVVRDMKSKELQTDSIKDLNTTLRTVGNFEDYYIPTWDDEKPIEFDTIQGMDVQSDREWNEFLLKSVIKGTGFPANYIDSSNEVDFARTVIMQNQLLVRKVVSDQTYISDQMTELVKRIYKFEFDNINNNNLTAEKDSENLNDEEKELQNLVEEIVNNLSVVYSPPVTLNLNNVNDQINNASQTLDFIINSYCEDQDDSDESKKVKLKFRRKVVEKLIPSIDFEEYDQLFKEASMETTEERLLDKTVKKDDDDMYGDDFGGDDFGGGGDSGSSGGGNMDFGGGDSNGDTSQQPQNNQQPAPDQSQQGTATPDGEQINGVDDLNNNQMGF